MDKSVFSVLFHQRMLIANAQVVEQRTTRIQILESTNAPQATLRIVQSAADLRIDEINAWISCTRFQAQGHAGSVESLQP